MSVISENSAAQHRKMTETPMLRLVTGLALPTTCIQLITVIYNTADTYFVSKISNSASAAVGVVFSLMSLIQALGFGVSMGAGSIVSTGLGKRDDEGAQRVFNSALLAAVVLGSAIAAVGSSTLEPLMRLLGSTGTMLPYSCQYAQVILLGAPVMCLSFVLNTVLRSQGMARLAAVGMCSGGVLNAFLDPLLIFACDLGIRGAAVATVISQAVSMIILLTIYFSGRSLLRIDPRCVSRDVRTYLSILRVGFPTICRQGMASLATALLNRAAGVYGDAAVAGITISNKCYSIVRSLVIGVGQGFQPVAGYNFGAGRKRRVREAFRVTVLLGTAICVAASVLMLLFAPQIIAFFRDDPDVVASGAAALRFVAAALPTMAYSTIVNQLYQCLGFTVRASILASCRQGICFVPLILLLPRLFELNGVAAAQPVSDLCTFLISIPFRIVFCRTVLKEEKEEA